MKIKIYDPAMCCSTGVCGPNIDPVLLKMSESVLALKKQGVEVLRFNLSQQPKEFINNKSVSDLLQKKGTHVLPITIVNEKVFITGKYPDYEDLCKELGIEPVKTVIPINFKK